jgi:bifunctional DNA-binding transcriptional regulator/antitoxin component of YhaV-PrlF toxin-antitoxin module
MEDCGDKRGDTVSIPYHTRTNLGIKEKTAVCLEMSER